MKGQTAKGRVDRRDFFKKAGLAVGIAGATAATLKSGGAAKAQAAPTTTSSGYRETAHVRTYYQLAKF